MSFRVQRRRALSSDVPKFTLTNGRLEEDLEHVEVDIQCEPKTDLLELQLQKAIDKEEYEMAARIRDKINKIED